MIQSTHGAAEAIDAPLDAGLIAIVGEAGTGKTTALLQRLAGAAATGALDPGRTLLASPSPFAAARLGALAAGGGHALRGRWLGVTLDRLAVHLVAQHALEAGAALDVRAISDAEALDAFARAGASLFAMEWLEFVSDEIDPELAGLRTPERFAAAALRLIRKLRAAGIGPDDFATKALRGSVAFYAKLPNFANPDLLIGTREEYRDSLHVSAAELERQRRHEVDLAKVIARLYRSYLDELVAAGQLTRADAIAEATRLLGAHPAAAASARATVEWAFIDDAQDLGIGELRFLQALFGERLARATFAGDAAQTTQTFAGARPERTFALAVQTFVLEANHRVPPAVAGAARLVVDPRHLPLPAAVPPEPAVRLRRVSQQSREAQALADDVTALLASGTAPEAIAVVARGLVGCAPYADALLERDVAITFAGAFDLFDDPDAEDALALLWSACDPFRHDYLLRALQGPTMRLSDASLQILCSEPPNPQTLLFELPGEEANAAASRWDRRRDLRLAMNVTRGDRDAHLAPEARERLVRFRERRARWASLARAYPAEAVADVAFAEGGLLERRRGETAARLHKRLAVLAHLREEIVACCKLERSRTLADFLASTQTLAASEDRLVNCMPCAQGAVVIGSVEGVKGAQFDHVFIVNVRAGAFPPYYAPDSFLFSPNYGMIPKDNVGDASAARTAKFTWYMHHAKLRETFVAEERRALACAMTRARRSVTLSTWGKATRGIAAPEIVAELSSRRIAGVADVSPR